MPIRLLLLSVAWLASHTAQAQPSWQVRGFTEHDRSICGPLRAALARGLLALAPASIPPANAAEIGYIDFGPQFLVRSRPPVRRVDWEHVNYRDWGVADGVVRARVNFGTEGRSDVVHRWHNLWGTSAPVTITGHDPAALSPERLAEVRPAELMDDARWVVSGHPQRDRDERTRSALDADLIEIGGRTVILQWDHTPSRQRSWILAVQAGAIEASGAYRLVCSIELGRPQ